MKDGEGSKTAALVCLMRAAAHGRTKVAKFSDPTALALLPDEAKESLARYLAGTPTADDALLHRILLMRSEVLVTRTVAVDEAVRGRANPQVVNLGAGLDGRPWRMSELADAVVFEVDHPASQAEKQARSAGLALQAKALHFVAVDFAKDSLGDALARAGHDAAQPTTWLWEGVVPYLTEAQVEATLAVVAARSAPGSRAVVHYHVPVAAAPTSQTYQALTQTFWKNEPLQSWWPPEKLHALLERVGFTVTADRDFVELAAAYGADLRSAGPRISDGHIAVADR